MFQHECGWWNPPCKVAWANNAPLQDSGERFFFFFFLGMACKHGMAGPAGGGDGRWMDGRFVCTGDGQTLPDWREVVSDGELWDGGQASHRRQSSPFNGARRGGTRAHFHSLTAFRVSPRKTRAMTTRAQSPGVSDREGGDHRVRVLQIGEKAGRDLACPPAHDKRQSGREKRRSVLAGPVGRPPDDDDASDVPEVWNTMPMPCHAGAVGAVRQR